MNTKKECEALKQEISEHLGLSMEDLFWLQIDLGLEFLNNRLLYPANKTPDLVEGVLRSEDFWIWWRQIWANTDREFLANYTKLMLLEFNRSETGLKIYRAWHSPKDIQQWPNIDVIAKIEKSFTTNSLHTLSINN